MSDYKYIYISPIEKGYTQFKLTKKQHNELFPHRKYKWFDKYEYYYNDNNIILQNYCNWMGVILETLSFPVKVLIYGLSEIKEIWKDQMSLFNQKKMGCFSSDEIWSNTDTYKKVMEVINKGK